MGVSERKQRQRDERERQIIHAARHIAEREGWAAVTIRRLADEIEYSQPVLYTHYANREAIVAAVAVNGFVDITKVLREAVRAAGDPVEAASRAADAYLTFAAKNPALYEAMFVLPTGLRFGTEETIAPLREAFAALAAVVAPFHGDIAVATEFLWSALHGLAELDRTGRIRPEGRLARLDLLIRAVAKPPGPPILQLGSSSSS
jgi:AcrR family transcriptional regulator